MVKCIVLQISQEKKLNFHVKESKRDQNDANDVNYQKFSNDDMAKIKKKTTSMNKKFVKIVMHQFASSFTIPEEFAPTVIGNFS